MKKTSMQHPPIRFHALAVYDRGAKARWLLSELGVPYETRMLDREKKENESPEYLRLNPMGRAPTLEFGDTVIFESGAILSFLADHFADGGLAPAPASSHRGEYLKWMYFAASTLDPIQTRIMIVEDIPAGELYDKKFPAIVSDLNDALETLDLALAKSKYLVNDSFTAADIAVGYHLSWSRLWPELDEHIVKHPRVTEYLDRLKNLPSAVAAKAFSHPS